MNEETRKMVQLKSQEIGHCVCSIDFPCPCKFFRDKNICHCAGEYVDTKEWLNYNSI
jgi:hypothetical protein